MLPTGGNGNTYIKYVEKNKVKIYTGDASRVEITDAGLTVNDALAVTGASTIGGALTVTGATTFTGNASTSGYLSASGDLKIGANAISSSADLNIQKDITAPGGFVQSLTFSKLYMLQGGFASMTASYASASLQGDGRTPISFVQVPVVRSGSVLGLVVSVVDNTQIIKSGALSASVTLNGANIGTYAVGHTGTFIAATFAKDTYTFNPGQRIGVSLSASAGYLSIPDVVSASFIASVLVEM